jgi:uncharacterized membrane protein
MDGFWLDWLSFALRWLHVIAGIAWIGASFYFIWLDQSLVTPTPEKAARGLKGELWAIHGGGIYEVGKYKLAPPQMPEHLHWFKWEAYSTWLSGFALLLALYYTRADSYLIDATTLPQSAPAAIAASILFLLATLALYELALRSPLQRNQLAFAATIAVTVFVASWVAWKLFAPRAATLHVGAALATIMAGNVFLGIIPAQKKLVAAIAAGTEPDPQPAVLAKLRSTHNNYFTLPVLFCMLANHAPFFYVHPDAWLLLPCFAVTVAIARHFFNLRNVGVFQPQWLVGAAALTCVLVFLMRPAETPAPAGQPVATQDEVARILATHCVSCHAQVPTFAGYASPPAGLVFDTPEKLLAAPNGVTPERVANAVRSGFMPLGNTHGMTGEDRAMLVAWVTRGR